MPSPTYLGGCWIYIVFEQDKTLKNQRIHVRRQEAAQGILRRTDNRLAADVEAGVDEHGAAGPLIEGLEQTVKARLAIFVEGLHTRAVIDMGHGRPFVARHIHPMP